MNRLLPALAIMVSLQFTGWLAIAQDVQLVETVVRGENVRIREEPAADSIELAVLQRGDLIQVEPPGELNEEGTWWYVLVPETGEEGWVRWQFVVGATADPEAEILGASVAIDPSMDPKAEQSKDGGGKPGKEERKAAKKVAKQNLGDGAAAAEGAVIPLTDQFYLEGSGTQTLPPMLITAETIVGVEFGALGDDLGGPVVVIFTSETDGTENVAIEGTVEPGGAFSDVRSATIPVEDVYRVTVSCPCAQWTITLTPEQQPA